MALCDLVIDHNLSMTVITGTLTKSIQRGSGCNLEKPLGLCCGF